MTPVRVSRNVPSVPRTTSPRGSPTGPTANPSFLSDQPLWQRLGAVREGRVVAVDALRWATMSSIPGSWWVFDDLAAPLIEGAAPVLGAASPAGLERLRGYRSRSML